MMNSSSPWFDGLPVLGALPPEKAVARLREAGEDEVANAINATKTAPPSPIFGIRDWFTTPPYLHTAHAFGYIAPNSQFTVDLLPIQPVGSISADPTLKKSRLTITLGLLRVASYPGGGTHHILLHFFAQNQIPNMPEPEKIHFNATYRVREGQHAAVRGYPVFVGLNVGSEGMAFRCRTILVKNERDEAFLSFFKSDIFKTGLKLATTVQPAIAPLSAMAYGLAETVASYHRNVSVQDFDLGLDFGNSPAGAHLAEGAYLAVQIPDIVWEWDKWVYHPASGQVVMRTDPEQAIPYNYLLFNVSRYTGD